MASDPGLCSLPMILFHGFPAKNGIIYLNLKVRQTVLFGVANFELIPINKTPDIQTPDIHKT